MDIPESTGHCGDILLLRAEKGAQCSRITHPELSVFDDTEYFDIYGPTIIASNEQLHKILETRCLPIIMPNRPGDYENPRPEFGLEQKERLTAFRAKHLSAIFPDIEIIDGIAGRLWDITKPLFYINSLLPVDANILKDSILAIAGEKDETRKDTLEGRLVAISKKSPTKAALIALPNGASKPLIFAASSTRAEQLTGWFRSNGSAHGSRA